MAAFAAAVHAQCHPEGWQGGYRMSGSEQDIYTLAPCIAPGGEIVPGQFYAGGMFDFSTDGGRRCQRIAKWNGMTWEPVGTVYAGVGSIVTRPNGELIVGGVSTINGGTPVNGVARWDGTRWQPLGTGIDNWPCTNCGHGSVGPMVVMPNGDVVVGGQFSRAGETPAQSVARWDGATWSALGSGCDGSVASLAVRPNGDLIAAGYFLLAGGVAVNNIASWDGTSWHALGAGITAPANTQTVTSLVVLPNGDLIAGGGFTSAGGSPASQIARWNGSAWSPLGLGVSGGVINSIAALPRSDGGADVIVGGDFTSAGGLPITRLARWDGIGWSDVAHAAPDNSVRAVIALPDRTVYVAGFFGTIGALLNSPHAVGVRLAESDSDSSWFSLGDGLSTTSYCIASLPNGDCLVGGRFFFAGGYRNPGIAKWNGRNAPLGERWSAIAPGLTYSSWRSLIVNSLIATNENDFVAAGEFSIPGLQDARIARWDGSSWHGLGGEANSTIEAAVRTPNGDIIVGGTFTRIGGVDVNYIARWNGVAWSPLGDGMNQPVYALTIDSDGSLVAGGHFTEVGGTPANRIARWTGDTWQPIGAGMSGAVYAIQPMPNGDLVAGGSFRSAEGLPVNRIARWNGSHWLNYGTGITSLSSGPSAVVRSLACSPEGELVVGGSFAYAGDQRLDSLARWNGNSWEGFGGTIPGDVRGLQFLPNGDLLVAGAFEEITKSDGPLKSSYFAHYSPGDSPRIKRQPARTSGCLHDIVSLSVSAAGQSPLTYKWQHKVGSEWIDLIDGDNAGFGIVANSATAAVSIASRGNDARTDHVRCVVSNSCGEVASDTADLVLCPADFTCDGFPDGFDYDAFVEAFEAGDPAADFNNDNFIDCFDYDDFVAAFESGCL